MISREMTIEEILTRFPQKSQKLAQCMTRHGLHCSSCSAATWETLEAGVFGHGMGESELESLILDLNRILEEESDPATISLTKKAAEKFLVILAEEGKVGWALRFGDQPGGCSGFEYVLDFSEVAEEDDVVFESHGVPIHVNKKVLPRLLGCEIDYSEGLMGSGFKISNPNVKSSCGCGHSQSY